MQNASEGITDEDWASWHRQELDLMNVRHREEREKLFRKQRREWVQELAQRSKVRNLLGLPSRGERDLENWHRAQRSAQELVQARESSLLAHQAQTRNPAPKVLELRRDVQRWMQGIPATPEMQNDPEAVKRPVVLFGIQLEEMVTRKTGHQEEMNRLALEESGLEREVPHSERAERLAALAEQRQQLRERHTRELAEMSEQHLALAQQTPSRVPQSAPASGAQSRPGHLGTPSEGSQAQQPTAVPAPFVLNASGHLPPGTSNPRRRPSSSASSSTTTFSAAAQRHEAGSVKGQRPK